VRLGSSGASAEEERLFAAGARIVAANRAVDAMRAVAWAEPTEPSEPTELEEGATPCW